MHTISQTDTRALLLYEIVQQESCISSLDSECPSAQNYLVFKCADTIRQDFRVKVQPYNVISDYENLATGYVSNEVGR